MHYLTSRLFAASVLAALSGCDVAGLQGAKIGGEVCADPTTYGSIKKAVFDDVRKSFYGDVKHVNDLEKVIDISVDAPVATEINTKTSRVDCEGRMALKIPPAYYEAFGRETELSADIGYTAQSTADGKGVRYQAGGYGPLVERIQLAAQAYADKAAETQLRQAVNVITNRAAIEARVNNAAADGSRQRSAPSRSGTSPPPQRRSTAQPSGDGDYLID